MGHNVLVEGTGLIRNVQIMVGSIVTKAPASNLAANAYLELGIAVDLFTQGAGKSFQARGATVRLINFSNCGEK